MTWPAALSGAAVRVLRTAAGRRALQLALLVGGLFALGFLCGEQAHAAERTTPGATASSASSVSAVSPVASVTTEDVVRSVSAQVTRPVGGVVGTVTRDLDEARAKAPSLPELPALPKLPAEPSLPSPPVVEVPEPPLPGGPGVSPSPGTASAGHVGAAVRTEARQDSRTGRRTEPRATVTAPQGPRVAPDVGAPVTRAHSGGPRTGDRAGAPSRPEPAGDPDGVLADRAAVDGGMSRHADAYAVTPDHRAPLRLTSGAIARGDAPGTRDRHRDIPVFPG
ncbi:hypothetical protein ABZ915_27690 [Streptomyces sp. NPDC046915]|uniref:hypothetical protein n=1 Tax=Streptomyces sp. NPDC046915 TaxID=3155257 RepID=UPI00340D59E3